jgi:hypothetical protein
MNRQSVPKSIDICTGLYENGVTYDNNLTIVHPQLQSPS